MWCLPYRSRASRGFVEIKLDQGSERQVLEHVVVLECTYWCLWTKALLLGEPSPCNPSAETALQPLIWCSESLSSYMDSSPEECFFHRRRYVSDETFATPSIHELRIPNLRALTQADSESYLLFILDMIYGIRSMTYDLWCTMFLAIFRPTL